MSKLVIVVTGASSGIGLELTRILAKRGHQIYATARRPEQMKSIDGVVEILKLDVTDTSSIKNCIEHVIASEGRIDVLVNNAGFAQVGGWEEVSLDQVRAQFETNLFGALACIQAVLPHMRKAGHGRIINVTSVMSFIPAPFWGIYAASKAALDSLSESLYQELRPLGIRVTAVQPGITRTPLHNVMELPGKPVDAYTERRGRSFRATAFMERWTGSSPRFVAKQVARAATWPWFGLRRRVGVDAWLLWPLRKFSPLFVMFEGIRTFFWQDWSGLARFIVAVVLFRAALFGLIVLLL